MAATTRGVKSPSDASSPVADGRPKPGAQIIALTEAE